MLLERQDTGFGSSKKANLHPNNPQIPANFLSGNPTDSCFIPCASARRSTTWTWKQSHPKPSSHQLGWFHFAGVKQKSKKTFEARSGYGQEFPGYGWHGMMSLGDNQAASFPPRLQSQVFMFQKRGKKKELFISMRSEPAWIFQSSHQVSKKEPTFLELQARLHPRGEKYPKRKEKDHLLDCCAAL